MYVERQGVNLAPKVKELGNRIEVLESVVKALQLEKPRMGGLIVTGKQIGRAHV